MRPRLSWWASVATQAAHAKELCGGVVGEDDIYPEGPRRNRGEVLAILPMGQVGGFLQCQRSIGAKEIDRLKGPIRLPSAVREEVPSTQRSREREALESYQPCGRVVWSSGLQT